MYYDRETQYRYIRRFVLSVLAIVSSVVLAVVIANNLKSNNINTWGPSGGANDPQSFQEGTSVLEQSEDEKETLYRVVSVTDGDTINIEYNGATTPLRLIGIDTPETVDSRTDVQCFGPEASDYLKSLLTDKSVRIEADATQDDLDKYGRLLRYVYLDNEDVGLKIISGGYGKEYTYEVPYQKQSDYKAAEAMAKQNKKGQWADGVCGNKEATTQTTPEQQCLIKGNISNKGEKIYHMPGQQYYDKTVIDTGKGERWFCTEQEAISAGWRKAKV